MKNIIILLCIFLNTQTFAQKTKITIEFNKNVEYFGYIIEQGDSSENDKNHPISIIINKFPNNKSNKTLFKLFNLASDIDYSTLVHLMNFLPEFPLNKDYRVSEKLAQYLGFNTSNDREKLDKIVLELNNYYKESHFHQIWNELKPYRNEIKSILEKNKPKSDLFSTMESFYQNKYENYSIQPILTLWSAGFAVHDLEKNKAIFIMGPLNSNYNFNDGNAFQNLAIHEFGHSFVNHKVQKYSMLLSNTKHLFKPIKRDMVKQGYSDWETCMIEHFVRAGEVIFRELVGDKEQSMALLKDYTKNRKFIYLEYIVKNLKYYRIQNNYSYEKSVKETLNNMLKQWKVKK